MNYLCKNKLLDYINYSRQLDVWNVTHDGCCGAGPVVMHSSNFLPQLPELFSRILDGFLDKVGQLDCWLDC